MSLLGTTRKRGRQYVHMVNDLSLKKQLKKKNQAFGIKSILRYIDYSLSLERRTQNINGSFLGPSIVQNLLMSIKNQTGL
jgi:hypothetical protein